MAVSTTSNKKIYTGNGSQTVFPYDFKIFANADLQVIKYTIADETEETLVLDTDYNVSGAGDDAGGDVTLLIAAPTSAYRIIILRDLTVDQTMDLQESVSFPAENIEAAFDRGAMIDQQLQEQIDRCIKVPVTDTEDPPDYATLLANATEATEVAQVLAEAAQEAAETAQGLAESAASTAAADAAAEIAATIAEVSEGSLSFVLDGLGVEIVDGVAGDIQFPFACTLTGWSLLADQSGAIKVDLWKDTYANFPPTDADSITNGHEPEIAASGVKATDADIADWSDVTVDAGDVLRINVDSCTTITRCALVLNFTRTI